MEVIFKKSLKYRNIILEIHVLQFLGDVVVHTKNMKAVCVVNSNEWLHLNKLRLWVKKSDVQPFPGDIEENRQRAIGRENIK